MMTQRDPWVNMLRTTLAAFGAGVGGADTVPCCRSTSRFPAAPPECPKLRRAASPATPSCCCWRSPTSAGCSTRAAGSWFVEDLTAQVAAKAWEHFQQIESRRRFPRGARCRAGRRADRRGRALAATDDIAHRSTARHRRQRVPEPRRGPAARRRRRLGCLRRALRGAVRGAARPLRRVPRRARRPPTVLLLPLGPLAEHNVRTTFAANLLASGGIEAVNPGPVDPSDDALAAAVARLRRHRRGVVRHRRPLRRATPAPPLRRCAPPGSTLCSGRTGEGGGGMPGRQPSGRLPDREDRCGRCAVDLLLTRLGA